MKTLEYSFTAPSSDIQHDMLVTMLAEIGFDSFMDEAHVLKAYRPAENRDDVAVEGLLSDPAFIGIQLLNVEEMPDKDWNELWESSYQPVVVNERCRVRAPFHEPDPNFEFDLVIEPWHGQPRDDRSDYPIDAGDRLSGEIGARHGQRYRGAGHLGQETRRCAYCGHRQ